MIRAVIDTNVLVSGLLSSRGNEALIILAVHQGLVRPCISAAILKEYAEVLARPKFAFPSDEIAAVFSMFRERGEMIDPQGDPPALPDPDDTKFLHCAEAAGGVSCYRQRAALPTGSVRRGARRGRG